MSRRLTDLPADIIVDILLRLPAKSLCHIRCVSKTFNNVVDDPAFVMLHTRLQAASNAAAEVPQLILADYCSDKYKESTRRRFALKPKPRYKAMWSKQIGVHYIRFFTIIRWEMFVFHNLVCFGIRHCFLVDALRRQVLELPSNNVEISMLDDDRCWYGMGFDDTNDKHKIVRVISKSGKMMVHVLVLGTTSWRKIDSVPPCHLPPRNVSAYGDTHWLSSFDTGGEYIISFDFKKEEFHWTPHPPNIERTEYTKLLNLKGCMAIMAFTHASKSAQIWMLKDYETKEWTHDYTINLHSHYLYFANSGRIGEWEHGIYVAEQWYCSRKALLLDLRSGDMVEHKISSRSLRKSDRGQERNMLSCTGSLLSLKKYGKIQGICSDVRPD